MFSSNRRGAPAGLSAAALHPHLPDSAGSLQPGAVAALLPAVRPAGRRRTAQPAEPSLRSLELTDILLPLLLVYYWWV